MLKEPTHPPPHTKSTNTSSVLAQLHRGVTIWFLFLRLFFLSPSLLPQLSLERIPQQVVVSGLEALSVPEEHLLDKLELFFSKPKNGGGVVDCIERLNCPDQLMLTFAEDEGMRKIGEGCGSIFMLGTRNNSSSGVAQGWI